MRILRRIEGVTLRDKVKSVDIRKELGVKSIKESPTHVLVVTTLMYGIGSIALCTVKP